MVSETGEKATICASNRTKQVGQEVISLTAPDVPPIVFSNNVAMEMSNL